ncbi:hypothetical protein, partial [Mycoplasmopsis verecunda]
MKRKKLFILHATILPTTFALSTILSLNPNVNYEVTVNNTDIWKDLNNNYMDSKWQVDYDRLVAPYQFNQWMKGVNDNKTLFEMSLPGTHDSGAQEGYGFIWSFGWRIARTQAMTIPQQLNAGIRAFDIRSNQDLRLQHGPANLNTNFYQVLAQSVEFLKQNPSEFIFMRIKDEDFSPSKNQSDAETAAKNYLGALSDPNIYPYLFNPTGKQYEQLKHEDFKLKNLRGKIIIANFWHHIVQEAMDKYSNKYTANTWSGGFDYDDVFSRRYTVQDNYDVTKKEKEKYVKDFFETVNNDRFNNTLLYANFFSIAKDGYPYQTARELNPKFHRFINENQQYKKLGIIFMDFPAPGIIQSIFKTNYYLTDDQLKKNYLLKWNNKLVTTTPIVNDNKVSIIGDTLKDYIFEISENNKLIKTIQVPNDAKSFVIDLGDDYYFNLNDNIEIKAYRNTPPTAFYESKKYNEFTLNNKVINSAHNERYLALLEKIKQYQQKVSFLNNENLNNYLKTNYLDKTLSYIRPNSTNEKILVNLSQQFDSESLKIDNLIDKVNNLISAVNDHINVNNSTLSLLLSSDLINGFKNIVTNIQHILNSYINNSGVNYLSIEKYINNYLSFINNIVKNIKDFLDKINPYVLVFNENLKWNNYGLQKWNNQIDSIKTLLLQQAEEYTSEITNKLLASIIENNRKIESLNTNVITLKGNIDTLNSLLESKKITQNRLELFKDSIKSEMEEPKVLDVSIKSIDTYLTNIIVAKLVIEKYDDFAKEFLFKENPNKSKEKYSNLINSLDSSIKNLDNPINPDYLITTLRELQVLSSYIQGNYKQAIIVKINNLALFHSQKVAFETHVQNSNNEKEADDILHIANNIAELNPLQLMVIESDSNINSNIKQLISNIKSIIDYEDFKNKLEIILSLVSRNNQLLEISNKIGDINKYRLAGVINNETANQYQAIDHNIQTVLNSSIDLEQYENAITQANELKNKLDTLLSNRFAQLSTDIENETMLYLFQKKQLEKELKEITTTNVNNWINDTLDKLITFIDKYNEIIDSNPVQSDKDSLVNLSEQQKNIVFNELNGSETKDDYSQLLNKFKIFNQELGNIKAQFNDLEQIEKDKEYAINYFKNSNSKVLLNTYKKELNNLLINSINISDISNGLNKHQNTLELMKQTYINDLNIEKDNLFNLISELNTYIEQELNSDQYSSFKNRLNQLILHNQVSNENDILQYQNAIKSIRESFELVKDDVVLFNLANSLKNKLQTTINNLNDSVIKSGYLIKNEFTTSLNNLMTDLSKDNITQDTIENVNKQYGDISNQIKTFKNNIDLYNNTDSYINKFLNTIKEDNNSESNIDFMNQLNTLLVELNGYKQTYNDIATLNHEKVEYFKNRADAIYNEFLKKKGLIQALNESKTKLLEKINNLKQTISQNNEISNKYLDKLNDINKKINNAVSISELDLINDEIKRTEQNISNDLTYLNKLNETIELIKTYASKSEEFSNSIYENVKENYDNYIALIAQKIYEANWDKNVFDSIPSQLEEAFDKALKQKQQIDKLENDKASLINKIQKDIQIIDAQNDTDLSKKLKEQYTDLSTNVIKTNNNSQLSQHVNQYGLLSKQLEDNIKYLNEFKELLKDFDTYLYKSSEFNSEKLNMLKNSYINNITELKKSLIKDFNKSTLLKIKKKLDDIYKNAIEQKEIILAKEEPAKEEPAKEEPAKEEPAKEEPAKEEPA